MQLTSEQPAVPGGQDANPAAGEDTQGGQTTRATAQWYVITEDQDMSLRLVSGAVLCEGFDGEFAVSVEDAAHAARFDIVDNELWLTCLAGEITADRQRIMHHARLLSGTRLQIGSMEFRVSDSLSEIPEPRPHVASREGHRHIDPEIEARKARARALAERRANKAAAKKSANATAPNAPTAQSAQNAPIEPSPTAREQVPEPAARQAANAGAGNEPKAAPSAGGAPIDPDATLIVDRSALQEAQREAEAMLDRTKPAERPQRPQARPRQAPSPQAQSPQAQPQRERSQQQAAQASANETPAASTNNRPPAADPDATQLVRPHQRRAPQPEERIAAQHQPPQPAPATSEPATPSLDTLETELATEPTLEIEPLRHTTLHDGVKVFYEEPIEQIEFTRASSRPHLQASRDTGFTEEIERQATQELLQTMPVETLAPVIEEARERKARSRRTTRARMSGLLVTLLVLSALGFAGYLAWQDEDLRAAALALLPTESAEPNAPVEPRDVTNPTVAPAETEGTPVEPAEREAPIMRDTRAEDLQTLTWIRPLTPDNHESVLLLAQSLLMENRAADVNDHLAHYADRLTEELTTADLRTYTESFRSELGGNSVAAPLLQKLDTRLTQITANARRLDALNEQAAVQFAQGAYNLPPDNNVVSTARSMLAIDSNNAQARNWLRQTADVMVARAEAADASGDTFAARNLLEDVLAFYPNHQAGRALFQRLNAE